MLHRLVIAATLAAGLALATPALALPAGGGGRAAVRQACASDIHKLCPDARPGPGGGMRACIRGHFLSFSDPCKRAIMTLRAERRQRREDGAANPPG